MQIEGYDGEVSAYISNDYLGMSQRPETKEAGINAVLKYGTGASAAQTIGGYLDIHKQVEEGIVKFVGQGDAILFHIALALMQVYFVPYWGKMT